MLTNTVIFTDDLMAEEVAANEEAELEALVGGWLDAPSCSASMDHNGDSRGSEDFYGSDEDEYDQVFMEFAQQESRTASQREDCEMMDMS